MDRQRRTEVFLQAAHRFAMERLRAGPGRIGEVRALLGKWRQQAGRTRSGPDRDEWEHLLALPLDEFERVICVDDEHATVLRSVSPIGAVISNAERLQLLREARQSASSQFDETFGDYADGVGPETAVMPADWMSRASLHDLGDATVVCPDMHDLAVSKCVAGR